MNKVSVYRKKIQNKKIIKNQYQALCKEICTQKNTVSTFFPKAKQYTYGLGAFRR